MKSFLNIPSDHIIHYPADSLHGILFHTEKDRIRHQIKQSKSKIHPGRKYEIMFILDHKAVRFDHQT